VVRGRAPFSRWCHTIVVVTEPKGSAISEDLGTTGPGAGSAACSDCGMELPIGPAPVQPCPKCGSSGRDGVAHARVASGVGAANSPEARAREPRSDYHGGRLAKSAIERRVGMSRTADDGAERYRRRMYDRVGDRYEETILNPDGSVYRATSEPLSGHTGRGSARRSGPRSSAVARASDHRSARSRRTAVVHELGIAFDDAGHGTPTVVLIHGAFANRSHFAPQLEHLAQRHRVLTLDLRGHGESDVPKGGFRVRDFAADVIGVCETAGIDRAVLSGHSLGGAVALEVAAAKPDLVAGVALLDAAILYPERLRMRFLALLERDAPVEAVLRFFGRTLGPFNSPALKARVMEEIGRAPGHMVVPVIRDLMSSDFAAQLSSGDYPLVYVHAMAPTDLARLRQLRPDVLLASVAGSGHYLMLEVPDQVNAMLDRFLQIVASRS